MSKPLELPRARVTVVDDESAARDEIVRVLSDHGFCPYAYSDAQSALRSILRATPDAVVVDWNMPFLSGIELVQRMRAEGLNTPVIVISGAHRSDTIDLAFRAGADDMVSKPPGLELVARLRRAMARRDAPDRLRIGRLEIDLGTRSVGVSDRDGAPRPVELTRLETDLLLALARRAGHDVSIDALLDLVWGISKPVQPHAVEVAVGRLRAKLGGAGGHLVRTPAGAYRLGKRTERGAA